jgi:hypothetical protein
MDYMAATSERDFIPVVFRESDVQYVPRELFAGTVYVVERDWHRLMQRMRGLPAVNIPGIGSGRTDLGLALV